MHKVTLAMEPTTFEVEAETADEARWDALAQLSEDIAEHVTDTTPSHINWQTGDIPTTIDGNGSYCIALVRTKDQAHILCEFYPADAVAHACVEGTEPGFFIAECTSVYCGTDIGERIRDVERWALIL